MTPERLEQIHKLFAEALELAPPERQAFLVRSCGADLDLLAEVESLLAESNSSTTSIDGFRIMLGTAERSALKVGDFILNRFRIIRLLGRGGMGEVYEAQDSEIGRVALKTIREDIRSEPILRRFKQEVQLARMVTNPHVCRIHELFTLPAEHNRPAIAFLTMEFLEGTNLADRIAQQGPLPWRDAELIAFQLCEGLDAIHSAKIVHRDFKSRNVMLTTHNGVPRAVVMDMGLAHSPEFDGGPGKDRSQLTLAGSIMGTPHYMSPEQFEDSKVSASTDIYAFGVVLYEMVTGKLPFESSTPMAAAVSRGKHPPSASSIQPDVPHRWDRVIEKCLNYEPEQRFQSAGELAAALRSRSSVAVSLLTVIGEGARRFWLGLVLASLGLLVAAGLGVKLYQNRPAPKTVLQCAGIPPLAAGKYLAVLPFRGEGSLNVAEGVTEKLSTDFPNVPKFHISTYVDNVAQGASPQKTACDLGANLIVQGTLSDEGDKIRVHWTLADMEHGKGLIAESLDKPGRDLLYVVNDVCSRIAAVLELKPQAPPTLIEKDAYSLFLKGEKAIRDRNDANRFEVAIQFYNRALSLDPKFALAYAGLADAYYAKYDETKVPDWAERSVYFAEQAVALRETLPEAQLSLGTAYTAVGKTGLAIQHLKRALELRPNSDSAYRRLGRAYRMAGQKDNAIAAFQQAVSENTYYWNNHYQLGEAYRKYGYFTRALEEFRRVKDLRPNPAIGYAGEGSVYHDQGKFQESKVAYEKALDLEKSYRTYSNLGTAYFFLKDYKTAATEFELAVSINPDDDLARNNLADAYRWSGQVDKAYSEYDDAIRLAKNGLITNPNDTTMIGNLALYYAKRGKSDMAFKEIGRALARDRHDPDLIYDETVIKTLAGKPTEALIALRKLLLTSYSIRKVLNDPELNELLRKQRPIEFDKLTKEFEKKNP